MNRRACNLLFAAMIAMTSQAMAQVSSTMGYEAKGSIIRYCARIRNTSTAPILLNDIRLDWNIPSPGVALTNLEATADWNGFRGTTAAISVLSAPTAGQGAPVIKFGGASGVLARVRFTAGSTYKIAPNGTMDFQWELKSKDGVLLTGGSPLVLGSVQHEGASSRSMFISVMDADLMRSMPATAHAQSWSWGQPEGNLVSNWSFENEGEFWNTEYSVTYPAVGQDAAFTGRKVAKIEYSCAVARCAQGKSDRFPLVAGEWYTFSAVFQAMNSLGYVRPEIEQFSSQTATTPLTVFNTCADWTLAGGWTLRSCSFQVPRGVHWGRINLAVSGNGGNGTLLIDDVVLEEGNLSLADVVRRREGGKESVVFAEPMRGVVQMQSRVEPGRYRVNAQSYDAIGRPDTSYLPSDIEAAIPGFVADPEKLAKDWYNGTTAPSTSYPKQTVQYAKGAGQDVARSSKSGAAWNPANGKVALSGWYVTNFLPNPRGAATQFPATWSLMQTGPGSSVSTSSRLYKVNWSKGEDGTYVFAWANTAGQKIMMATHHQDAAGTPQTTNWKYTQYEYYPTGELKRVALPLEFEGVANNSAVYTYSQRGEVIARMDDAEGLVKFWYDVAGRLRVKQTLVQRLATPARHTYYDYDEKGRLIREGEVEGLDPTIANIDKAVIPSSSVTKKIERIGYVYDDVANVMSRCGLSSNTVQPPTLPVGENWGRLVAKYNRNPDPTGATSGADLVVDMFSYDVSGRVQWATRYDGGLPAEKQLQGVRMTYDSAGRIFSADVFKNADFSSLSIGYDYGYDELGRIVSIQDGTAGQNLVRFAYNALGQVSSVTLGGNAAASSGTQLNYYYHLHGQVRLLRATTISTGKVAYEELLGYEAAAISGGPSPVDPSWEGRITQKINNYGKTSGALPAVHQRDYTYDAAGRMTRVDGRVGTVASSSGTMAATDVTATVDDPTISEAWTFDSDNRIASMNGRSYFYQEGSRLDHLSSDLPGRSVSGVGTFAYDPSGRMVRDNSRGMSLQWNDAGQIWKVTKGASNMRLVYDADGQMARRVITNGTNTITEAYVNIAGTSHKLLRKVGSNAVTEEVFLRGATSVVGRKVGTEYRFFVKDHQGSTIREVNVAGDPAGKGTWEYASYGKRTDRVGDASAPRQMWTTKELDEFTSLYYFGARWYDPELGLWISPDPAHQFASPYAYGTNPTLGVDPNGQWFIVDDIIGGLIGAGVGAYTAYQQGYDLTDWQTYAYIGGGAAIGVATVETGGAAGAWASGWAGGGTAGAITSGAVAGAAGGALGGAANYSLSSGIESGFSNFDASQAWDATWKGGASGAVGGAVGGYMNNSSWNMLGRHGAALTSGAASGGTNAYLNGGDVWEGMWQGAAFSVGTSVASDIYARNFGSSPYDAQGDISSRTDLEDGTAVVFEGEGFGKVIEYGSGERYSHAGVIERSNGELYLREAQPSGTSILTPLSKFDSRAYSVVGRGANPPVYMNARSFQRYNLAGNNCSMQAGYYSNLTPANNPGIFYGINNGGRPPVVPYWW